MVGAPSQRCAKDIQTYFPQYKLLPYQVDAEYSYRGQCWSVLGIGGFLMLGGFYFLGLALASEWREASERNMANKSAFQPPNPHERRAEDSVADGTLTDERTIFSARQLCALTQDRLYRVYLDDRRFYLIYIGGQAAAGLDAIGMHFGLLGVLIATMLKGKTKPPEEIAALDVESPKDLLGKHKHSFSFSAADIAESTLDPPSAWAQHGPHVARWLLAFRDGTKRQLQIEQVEDLHKAMEALPAVLGPLVRISLTWDEKTQKYRKP